MIFKKTESSILLGYRFGHLEKILPLFITAILIGLIHPMSVYAGSMFAWPVTLDNKLNTGYPYASSNPSKGHSGSDIYTAVGTPIYAPADGTCSFYYCTKNGKISSYGNFIDLNTGTYVLRFCHLSKFAFGVRTPMGNARTGISGGSSTLIESGISVSAGTVIGYTGEAGNATGPHLHIEVLSNGTRQNPMNYYDNTRCANNIVPDPCNCSDSYAGTYICTSNTTLNIRNTHGTSGRVLGSIPSGAEVYVSKADGTWAHVSYGEKNGYASMQYLKKKTVSYSFDLNGLLDGNESANLGNYGTADVYINGSLVADDQNDYYNPSVPANYSYQITDIKAKDGYEYKGVNSGSLNGIVNGNINVKLSFTSIPRGAEMVTGGSRVIPEGDYLIAAAGTEDKSTFYYLDIEGTAQPASNGTNVSLCGPLAKNPPSYEIWTLSYQDGFYTIKQKGTNMALDVVDASPLSGKNVWVYQSNGSSAQKWAISYNGTDGYRIQAKCSGFSLDINGGNITNGVNVQQWENNSSKAQSWMFIPYQPPRTIPDGRYILLSEIDETYELDVSGDTGDVENGANVQIWKDTAQSQYNSFDIKQQSDGYYIFTHVASGKELSSLGGTSTAGQNIGLYESNGHPAHKWAITNDGNNDGYVLRTKCSGMVMDVENGIAADGTNVRQLPYNGTKAQTWKFVKAEYTITFDPNGGTTNWSEKTKNYNVSAWLWRAYSPKRTGYEFLGWTEEGRDSTRVDYVQGSYYEKNADVTFYAVWKKLEPDMILPANLKTVEEEAFAGGAFTYVQIPEGTKTIGSRAFADCNNLKMIAIPESVVNISAKAFEGVDGLNIYGKDGSYAEFYAKKHGFEFLKE